MNIIENCETGFLAYPKINTLFERGEDFVVNPAKLKSPVLATISEWDVTEKIDGTNVRVALTPELIEVSQEQRGSVRVGGRTDNAQMPPDLVSWLYYTLTPQKMMAALQQPGKPPVSYILFGEGYGPGIQKGAAYRKDKSFILYDVLCEGRWWLDRSAVNEVAGKLGIDVVPYLGRMTLTQIVELVRQPFPSKIGMAMAEGIVARPIETLYDKHGERIVIKLKTKDFVKGKR